MDALSRRLTVDFGRAERSRCADEAAGLDHLGEDEDLVESMVEVLPIVPPVG